MEQLRLLLLLGDAGVEHVFHDDTFVYFFPAQGKRLIAMSEALKALVKKNKPWLMKHVRRLPAGLTLKPQLAEEDPQPQCDL